MPDGNEIFKFLKENGLTQKDEATFTSEYSDPKKAAELHKFFVDNQLTTKDSAAFYDTYFNPQKKKGLVAPTVGKQDGSTSNLGGVQEPIKPTKVSFDPNKIRGYEAALEERSKLETKNREDIIQQDVEKIPQILRNVLPIEGIAEISKLKQKAGFEATKKPLTPQNAQRKLELDGQISIFEKELTPLIEKSVEANKGRFSKDGKIDYKSIYSAAEGMSKNVGGGKLLKEVFAQKMIEGERVSLMKPKVEKFANEIYKNKTGKTIDEEFSAIKSKAEAEQLAEAAKQKAYVKKEFATLQKEAEEKITEESKTLFNEVYAPQFDLITDQKDFDETVAKYRADLKNIVERENSRLKRIGNELNRQAEQKIEAFAIKYNLPQSKMNEIKAVYDEAYDKAIESDYEAKAAAQKETIQAVGVGGLFIKSLAEGFNIWLASSGAGIVGLGMNNGLTDWLRSRQQQVDALQTIDLPFEGLNLLRPETYATRLGKQLGMQAPAMALTFATRNPYIGGTIGMLTEQTQIAGDTYNQVLQETGDPARAAQAAQNVTAKGIGTAPLYFIEADMFLKAAKGIKQAAKSMAIQVPIENVQELTQGYGQFQETEKGKGATFKEYFDEQGLETIKETTVLTILQQGAFGGIGQAYNAIATANKNVGEQYLLDIVRKSGLAEAGAVVEQLALNGKITDEELISIKESMASVDADIQAMRSAGVEEKKIQGYIANLSAINDIKKQESELAADSPLRQTLTEKRLKLEQESRNLAIGGGTSVTVTLPNGTEVAVPKSNINQTIEKLAPEIADDKVSITAEGESASEVTKKVDEIKKARRLSKLKSDETEEGRRTTKLEPINAPLEAVAPKQIAATAAAEVQPKELESTEEVINFKKKFPDVKEQKFDITTLKSQVDNWAENNKHPKDIETIEQLSKKDIDKLPPIILGEYGGEVKIIDGWHRVYVALKQGKTELNALIEPTSAPATKTQVSKQVQPESKAAVAPESADVESTAKKILGETAVNKLKKQGYKIVKGKFDRDAYADFFGVGEGVQADEFEKSGLTIIKPFEKIKVFRGVGKNVEKGDNNAIQWVAEDERIAKNYSSENQIQQLEVNKPQKAFENPENDVYVTNKDVANRLRKIRDKLFRDKKIDKKQAEIATSFIDEFEQVSGNEPELYSTKTNKKESADLYAKSLISLGYDGIVQKESFDSKSPFKQTTTENSSNTYGIFNPKLVKAVEQLLGKPKEATPQAGSVVSGEVAKIEEEPLTNEEEKLAEEIKITKDDAKRAKKSNPKRTRKSKDIARVVESETKIAEDTKDARRAKGLIETIERTEEAILNNEPVDETFEQKHGVSEIAIVNELKEMGKQGDFYTAYQNLTGKEANIETEIDFLSSISAQGIKLRPKLSVEFTEENHIVETKPLKKKPTKKTGIDSLQNIVSDDLIRPAMNGVYFDGKNMVATDAHKLIVLPKKESDAYIIEKLIDSNYKKTKKTVPTYTREQATKYIKEQLKGGLNGKILDFNQGMVVDAVYPKYEQVIPNYKKGIKVDLQELIDILNGAKSVQENLSNNIFGISIRLGGEVSVFNPSLFMDLALSMQENGAKTVEVLNEGDSTKATLLKSDNGITGLIMPLAAKNEFPVSQVYDLSTKPTEAKPTEAKLAEAKPTEAKPTKKAKLAEKPKSAAEPKEPSEPQKPAGAEVKGEPKETTDFSKAISASSRFRPYETVIFDKPIIGKNGNKLISYQWAYEWTMLPNWEGELKSKRVSDWTQAESSAETGRDIVHKFTVERTDGVIVTVSSETIPSLLGYVDAKEMKNFPSIVSSVKTLAKQRMQLAILKAQEAEYNAIKKEVNDLPKPKIVPAEIIDLPKVVQSIVSRDNSFLDKVKYWKTEGEIKVVYRQENKSNTPDNRTKEQLLGLWESAEIERRGGKKPQGLYDLERRIERQEKKVEQTTGSKLKAVEQLLGKPKEAAQTAAIKPEIVTEKEVAETAKKTGITPKNLRDLYNINRKLFGLDRIKSLASAIAMDRMVGVMAKRAGITKEQMYGRLEFEKASERDLPQGVKFQVDAWHGSPYEFDKFTTQAIGTGEGAQAFGWGLYFTDLKGIAEEYARRLANDLPTIDGKKIDDWFRDNDLKAPYSSNYWMPELLAESKSKEDALSKIDIRIKSQEGKIDGYNDILDDPDATFNERANARMALENLEKDLQVSYDLYNAVYRSKEFTPPSKNRNLYKVSLHKGKSPDQYTWLEWDKPLNKNSKIYADLKTAFDAKFGSVKDNLGLPIKFGFQYKKEAGKFQRYSEATTYAQLYDSISELLGGQKQASLFLLENGIDGVKYPAESISRGATSDTARGFNYVVFDENAVTIEEVIKFQKDAEKARGAMMISMDGQAVIYALTDPNVSTPLHEMAHVFEHYLNDAERAAVQNWAGTKAWTTKTSEAFARGFEKYLAEGKAPTTALQKIFEKFKQWLTDIYNGITGSEIDIELNDQMREIYAKMLGEEFVAPIKKEVTKERAATPITPQKKSLDTQKVIEAFEKISNLLDLKKNKSTAEQRDITKEIREASQTTPKAEFIFENWNNIKKQLKFEQQGACP